jgi:hypothetical protein
MIFIGRLVHDYTITYESVPVYVNCSRDRCFWKHVSRFTAMFESCWKSVFDVQKKFSTPWLLLALFKIQLSIFLYTFLRKNQKLIQCSLFRVFSRLVKPMQLLFLLSHNPHRKFIHFVWNSEYSNHLLVFKNFEHSNYFTVVGVRTLAIIVQCFVCVECLLFSQ